MFAVRDSNSSDVLIAAGSATGLDLTVTLGDVEDANNGTKIKIDDATETVQVSGSLDASGTIYCDNREAAFYRLSGNSMIFSNSSVNTSIRGTSILLQSSVTASGNVSSSAVSTASFGTYLGDGSQLTNLQRPISNSVSTNVTASNLNSGYYFRTGGNITCSIQSNAIVSCDVGSEFEFFQTSSAGNLLFHTGSGVTLNSKNGSTKLSNQFSAATLKKIDTNEWDLIGDLS